MRSPTVIAALGLGLVLLPAAPPLSAGPEKVAFPSGDQRSVLYADVDRPDIKQVRRLFAAPETARGARAGAPLPVGALLTMEIYAARTDDRGEPLRDGNGRLVRGDLTAVFVMEKRAGGARSIRTICATASGNTRGSPPTAVPAPPTPGRVSRATSPRRPRTTCSRPRS